MMVLKMKARTSYGFYHFLLLLVMLIFIQFEPGLFTNTRCAERSIGLENRYIIPDSSFTASSQYDRRYVPSNGRLNGNSGWGPSYLNVLNQNAYLQIDLGYPYVICAVATQGKNNSRQWVTTYKISTSMDGKKWTNYQENGRLKIFIGNNDSSTIKKHTLTKPLVRYIRFIPLRYTSWQAMRVGIYGHLKACENFPLGMESGVIPDNSIKASSTQDQAKNARLHYTSGFSWCASTSDSSPYLQIDLGTSHLICAAATQGNSMADQWVKTYQIHTSIDGTTWTTYQENNIDRIFYGNYDRTTVVRRVLYHGIVTRYLRIVPKAYETIVPCLRAEIYGFPSQTGCFSHSVGIPSSTLVPNHRFKATTYYGNRFLPYKGRLGAASSWEPRTTLSDNDYIQVDLGERFHVCAVATQGCGYSSCNKWATKYKVIHSTNNVQWFTYQESGVEKEFQGNTDSSRVVTNQITNLFRAKFVRVLPTAYNTYKSFRVEFKGIPSSCTSSHGFESALVPDSQMTSSSSLDNSHTASHGRLYGGSSWCSSTVSNTEHIQVDLGQIKTVTGIATQGDYSLDKWVTSYKVSYSFDNRYWNEYTEARVTKVFNGNTNKDDVIVNWITRPIAARYVRILPQRSNGGACLRLDLYGCTYFNVPKVSHDDADIILPSTKGSSRTLTCSVLGEPKPDIQWFNNGTKINNATQPRLQVQFTSAEDVVSNCNCTRQDPNNTRAVVCNTFYTCRAMYPIHVPSAGIDEASVKVTVNLNVPEAPVFIGVANQKSIALSWTAPTSAADVGQITWYTIMFNNQSLARYFYVRHPSSSFDLTYLKLYTNYTVRMKAISSVGRGLWSAWKNLRTTVASGVPTQYSDSTFWALQGDKVTIDGCYACGDKPIKYTWTKGGSPINKNSPGTRTRGDDLVIQLKSDKDFGIYFCNATNNENTVAFRITRVELKKYTTGKSDTSEKAKKGIIYVISLVSIILILIIIILYLVYLLRKEKQRSKKIKDKKDETGIQNDVIDHSNDPGDVTNNSSNPETAKADKIEASVYMGLKPRLDISTIYQSTQESANRSTESATPQTQGMTGYEQYMDLKPTTRNKYETLFHEKNAPEGQEYEIPG